MKKELTHTTTKKVCPYCGERCFDGEGCDEWNAGGFNNPTTTKGELLQEWTYNKVYSAIVERGEKVCNVFDEEKAKLICDAVNERQKLLDSNRELLDALKSMLAAYEDGKPDYWVDGQADYYKDKSIEAKSAINNAKNIQP